MQSRAVRGNFGTFTQVDLRKTSATDRTVLGCGCLKPLEAPEIHLNAAEAPRKGRGKWSCLYT